ncbi:hypothetical protein [Flavobacterium seoulense]|uniref:Uncharacterized protein n=1 Tax=Flavobacterium seoulense TaxID=1492738 RepID=A0A066WVG8_9FLAO|nr:hypothetical protein [Flavobacterium seoulense]KDN54929.1 hypothetical protein FEM21_19340 [Flavobacterium seoulense]
MNNSKANKTTSKSVQFIAVFVMFFMFSFSAFSQSQTASTTDFNDKIETVNVKLESSRATSNMEFALWFMGTKQDPNAAISTEGTNTKKMIMTSGIAPNRLLIKAFLKKVVNYENALS